MENIREVKKIAQKYDISLLFDSARFAENAYFIKLRENGFKSKSILEIVKEMFKYADIMTMSSKKDANVNMGGFLAMKNKNLFDKASVYNIMFEGFITYGGLSGRDMEALAQGLREGVDIQYLESRINQVDYLGKKIINAGIEIQKPIGGHAIFVNASQVLPHVKREEFPAQTLAIELYLEAGIRAVEVGVIMADRDPQTRENRYPTHDFVRLSIPRRVYTYNHLDVVAVALSNVYSRRNRIKRGYKILKEAPIMRHFTIELEKL